MYPLNARRVFDRVKWGHMSTCTCNDLLCCLYKLHKTKRFFIIIRLVIHVEKVRVCKVCNYYCMYVCITLYGVLYAQRTHVTCLQFLKREPPGKKARKGTYRHTYMYIVTYIRIHFEWGVPSRALSCLFQAYVPLTYHVILLLYIYVPPA